VFNSLRTGEIQGAECSAKFGQNRRQWGVKGNDGGRKTGGGGGKQPKGKLEAIHFNMGRGPKSLSGVLIWTGFDLRGSIGKRGDD